jgi:hypothetical protein
VKKVHLFFGGRKFRHFRWQTKAVRDVDRVRATAFSATRNRSHRIFVVTMPLNGDRTRPACRFRRLAENSTPPSFSAPFGEGQYV